MEYAHTLYEFIIVFSANFCQSSTRRICGIVDKSPFFRWKRYPQFTKTYRTLRKRICTSGRVFCKTVF